MPVQVWLLFIAIVLASCFLKSRAWEWGLWVGRCICCCSFTVEGKNTKTKATYSKQFSFARTVSEGSELIMAGGMAAGSWALTLLHRSLNEAQRASWTRWGIFSSDPTLRDVPPAARLNLPVLVGLPLVVSLWLLVGLFCLSAWQKLEIPEKGKLHLRKCLSEISGCRHVCGR